MVVHLARGFVRDSLNSLSHGPVEAFQNFVLSPFAIKLQKITLPSWQSTEGLRDAGDLNLLTDSIGHCFIEAMAADVLLVDVKSACLG